VRRRKVLKLLAGLGRATVIEGDEVIEDGPRPLLRLRVRPRVGRLSCGKCGERAPGYDQGEGVRSWRHVDLGFARCVLVGPAPRVECGACGVTVCRLPWARHDSAFTRDFEDVVVHDAVTSNKQAACERHETSWRAVNGMCERVLAEALGRVDLLDGLFAVALDEVKYKKGHKYLTVVCDHATGRVVWAHEGRSMDTVRKFFDALGDRASKLKFVTCDGAEWIRGVVTERAPEALICLDTFHLIGWATDAIDEVRRQEWNRLRGAGAAAAAKEFKGLRWLLLRNWENLSGNQQGVIRDLELANRRTFRAWQLKEELRDIMQMPLAAAKRALDDWLRWASRSRLEPFVKLARTVRHYRDSIEATIEWRLTNGIAESNNASIGRIRSAARGFKDPKAFITMIMLERGGLTPTLPWQRPA
jgi:transposase